MMSFYRKKSYWITGSIFGLVFLILFSIRIGLFENVFSGHKTLSISSISAVSKRDTWMNIFQNDHKIGFSHSRFSKGEIGYRLQETVYLRMNTMGLVQDINIKTDGRLNPDFSLASLNFAMDSGRFRFTVQGSISGNVLNIQTESAGDRRNMALKFQKKPYLLAGVINAVASVKIKPGDKFGFHIFDPATMSQQPVYVEVIGSEDIQIMEAAKTATKISISFKGASHLAWIDEYGNVLKEKGLLGIQLEKTNRDDALYGMPLESSRDLTREASVSSNVAIKNLDQLKQLKLEISGIPLSQFNLDGGRQAFKDRILVIEKESLSDLPADFDDANLGALEKIFLKPSPFIQSDHQKIRDLARKIGGTDSQAPRLEKAQKLLEWVHRHIDKRPVISLPDALSTLENRMGDCNEHAVLMAALARAAGIPCRVEAGLVYLKGRFYYHAWNLVYLGRWITADSLVGQMPADVSHIRFVSGFQQQQLDLMGIIGKVAIKVIE